MNIDYKSYYQSVRRWAKEAHTAGWLEQGDIQALDEIETQSAQDLFDDSDRRPLLVGFFGGTGVGKSSLLNKLAGQRIAATGVERPTSRRATLYLHDSRQLATLDERSPIADSDVAYHGIAAKKDVAWIDMPDIDSVEQANRELALKWLPYIDWLIYVVSPERYRDDAGWELIQRRQNNHHWLFVLNRWDEATAIQLDEFVADLERAGFDQPVVLCTSCRAGNEYDFARLEAVIAHAIDEHGLEELQRIGILARIKQLTALARDWMKKIGDADQWQRLRVQIIDDAASRLRLFKSRLDSELEAVVRYYPARPAFWRRDPHASELPDVDVKTTIWSGYCDELIENISMETRITLGTACVAAAPLSRRIAAQLDGARALVVAELEQGLARALVKPGTPVQRILHKSLAFLFYALPVVTACWAAYHVVTRYAQGLSGESGFLGFDFAVHSLMLIGLSWFVPFTLARWLRPSYRAAARRGLRDGSERAIAALEELVKKVCDESERGRVKLVAAFPKPDE